MKRKRRRDESRRLRAVLVLAMLSAAGCQPLPHPFADDRPPADLLSPGDSAGISIEPIIGQPEPAAAKLGAALAKALLQRDIPASEKTTSLGSYHLYGRLNQSLARHGSATVTAEWRLYDPEGKEVGEHSAKTDASPSDWESGAVPPIDRLAAVSAEAIAPMIAREPPPTAAAAESQGAPRIRVAIQPLRGAPGDGGKSLAAAMSAILRQQELGIVDDTAKPDLTIGGEVDVAPVKAGKQHVKILWRVRRADGAEVGTVGQENDVPKGILEGPWGDLAYSIAIAAGDGILQVIARGAPERHS